jgi:signal transduction histidine kinase
LVRGRTILVLQFLFYIFAGKEIAAMARFARTVFLIFCCYSAFCQPAEVVNGTYAAKYRFVDSIARKYEGQRGSGLLALWSTCEKQAISSGDKVLAAEIRLKEISERVKLKALTEMGAEKLFLAEMEKARAAGQHYVEADALQALGDVYAIAQHNAFGFENYLSAYAIYSGFTAAEFPPKKRYLFALGSTYYKYGDNENAIKYLKQAVAVDGFRLKDSYTEYNSIGLCYRNMGRYDSAEWYFRAIYDTATAFSDTVWAGIVMGNIGITYYYDGKYEMAKPLLQKDIAQSIAHRVVRNAVGSMLILGSLYLKEGELQQAERVMLEALRLCRERQFWYDFALAEKVYTQLFKIYALKKEPVMATLFADSAMIAKDSNNARNNALKFAKAQEKMDLVQRGLAEKQLQGQRKVNFFLALVSSLLFIIGVLAYLNQRMTAKLNKQILSQKAEVEQLNDVKDRIFSVISHDMRTPVNSLIAFTELLERGNISEAKMAAYAAALKNNLGYTARLMENLLNWARTQMQGYNPVLETFDIAGTVGQAVELLKREADKKGIAISNEVAEGSLVYWDMNMASLLVRNLMSNAVKFTPAGGNITLSSQQLEGALQVKVKDTGIGIAPDFVEAFNGGGGGQPIEVKPGTNNEKGTGLGLMLCKTFVALMKGKMWLESEPGKGSCFTVELPTSP